MLHCGNVLILTTFTFHACVT